VNIRPATSADLAGVARLHASRIREGFLSSLGTPFLARLYRRVVASSDSFVLVADTDEASTVGFVAGVADLGALYRRFLIRDGLIAGARAAPRLLRSVPRVVETLRYPTGTAELPDAEILAVAVGTDAGGRGIGRALVGAAVEEFRRAGITSAKVVTTAENRAALAMYRACGFVSTAPIEVHEGRASEVLVWTASSR